MNKQKPSKNKLLSFFLRSGLAIAFFYASISSFLNPDAWVGYFPFWLRALIPENILLLLFSLYELFLGSWLLSSRKMLYAGVVSAITLLAIIFTNVTALDIIFRDTAILFMAFALIALARGENHR